MYRAEAEGGGEERGPGLPFGVVEREGPEEGAAFRERGGLGFGPGFGGERWGGAVVFFFFPFLFLLFLPPFFRYTGTWGSPAMSAAPRFGGGPHDGDRKQGTTRGRR